MPKRAKKFSLEEHRDIGAHLHRIRHELMEITIRISNVYGKREGRTLSPALSAVNRVTATLDGRVCAEFPDLETVMEVYYPPSDGKVTTVG